MDAASEAIAIEVEWADIEPDGDGALAVDEPSRTTLVPEFDLERFARDESERTLEIKDPELRRLINESMAPAAMDEEVTDYRARRSRAEGDGAFAVDDLEAQTKYEEVLGLAHRLVVPRPLPANDSCPSSASEHVRRAADGGSSSIAAVVARCGLPRAQALAALCDLYQKGLVELVEP